MPRMRRNTVWNKIIMDIEPARQIIAALEGRCGFGSWWGCIQKEIQGQIIQEIAEIIYRHIEFNWR